jgi:ABC-2 type transport system permease protein
VAKSKKPVTINKLSLQRLLRLYALYARMDLAWLTRDRLFATVAIVSDVIANISSVTGVFLLAWRFGGIGGMTGDEVLLMLAYTTLVTGIFQLFFAANNTGHISRRIGRGQMETCSSNLCRFPCSF